MIGKIVVYVPERRVGLIIEDQTNAQYVFFPESLPSEIKNQSLKSEAVSFDIVDTVVGKQATNIALK